MVGADGGQVGHAHRLPPAFIDDREAPQHAVVAGVLEAHLLEEPVVDLEDQLQVAGQQGAEQIEAPCLEGLGQQGVVGVGEAGEEVK